MRPTPKAATAVTVGCRRRFLNPLSLRVEDVPESVELPSSAAKLAVECQLLKQPTGEWVEVYRAEQGRTGLRSAFREEELVLMMLGSPPQGASLPRYAVLVVKKPSQPKSLTFPDASIVSRKAL
jgi:hypothetical protein